MTISLLIPVCDYDIVALVHGMKSAIGKVAELCEIIIGNDGSTPEFTEKFRALEGERVRVISSEKNIGRAAIRNRLAMEATGDYLLFVDADAMLPGTAEAYLLRWLPHIPTHLVVCGGILYHDSPPGDPDRILRWKYGKWKEQQKAPERNKYPHACFTAFNVLINRSVFSRIRFNEELRQYGHEDTLFAFQLKMAGIDVFHIDNGLIHEGLESNREFLVKTKLGMENLSKLYDNITDKKVFSRVVTIIRTYKRLDFVGLSRILAGLFIRFRERMEIRLDSSDVSLRLFWLYKISMFCTFREIHRRKKLLRIVPHFKPPPS